MAKFQVLIVIAACLLAVSECQVQRQRQVQRLSRGRSRYFARQELAPADPDAVTPYPSADELKPEVPFDEAAAPAAAEPTPDAVYGPPDAAPNAVPDEVYGPPDVTGNDLPAADAAADVPAEQARLVAARRAAKLRRAQPVAYRRAAAAAAAARPAKLSAARSVVRRA
ncbi:hypothetical protein AWZ03_009496 [Drosophila navojoa]|uniref:DUF4794 domain-containing protein n=1 Tax=Drosophila navojoa TaxID=7232 RepID=A0A484B890_DRONA|nr:COPII coat assembly protein SEC16 [Drosophila navojoa]TDG44071.1 hypothetical protein AWZ03_009496 [Drosophila navojoa]